MVGAGTSTHVGCRRRLKVDHKGKLLCPVTYINLDTGIPFSIPYPRLRFPMTDGRSPMSRFKAAEPILAAAECWKQRCLLGAKSLFTERSLWTREGFVELRELYVEKSKDGLSATSYLDELELKLKPGSPDASCLWAEMTWVYHLIQTPTSMKAATKHARIRKIWNWSGRDFPADHDLLNDAVLEKRTSPTRVQDTTGSRGRNSASSRLPCSDGSRWKLRSANPSLTTHGIAHHGWTRESLRRSGCSAT